MLKFSWREDQEWQLPHRRLYMNLSIMKQTPCVAGRNCTASGIWRGKGARWAALLQAASAKKACIWRQGPKGRPRPFFESVTRSPSGGSGTAAPTSRPTTRSGCSSRRSCSGRTPPTRPAPRPRTGGSPQTPTRGRPPVPRPFPGRSGRRRCRIGAGPQTRPGIYPPGQLVVEVIDLADLLELQGGCSRENSEGERQRGGRECKCEEKW